jgi:hypothetical protein
MHLLITKTATVEPLPGQRAANLPNHVKFPQFYLIKTDLESKIQQTDTPQRLWVSKE